MLFFFLNIRSSDRSHESESWQALHRAIEDGNLFGLFLLSWIDIVFNQFFFLTLHYSGNYEEFERLLMIGADVNATDETTANSALLLATSKGRINCQMNTICSKIHNKNIAAYSHRPKTNGEKVNWKWCCHKCSK